MAANNHGNLQRHTPGPLHREMGQMPQSLDYPVIRFVLLLCFLLSLASCGQKGGLTRPQQAQTASFQHQA